MEDPFFPTNNHFYGAAPLPSTPAPVTPLNIAYKPFMLAPMDSTSGPLQDSCSSISSQSLLESNVRALCDMVDNVLKTSTELDRKQLNIDIHFRRPSNNSTEQGRDPLSPLFILSPRTFTVAKTDISKVDEYLVSQLNSDTLLDLFPVPPQLPPKAKSGPSTCPATVEPFTAVPPMLTEKPRPRSKNRNWVITSGLFLTLPGDGTQRACFEADPKMALLGVTSPNKDQLDSVEPKTESPTSPLDRTDTLSQQLWDVESQLRRPSFLMNRTSILSSLFVPDVVKPVAERYDQQERLLAELSLTVGSIVPPSEATTFDIEPDIDTIQLINTDSEQKMDWRGWHGTWQRKRMRPEDEPQSSSASLAPCTSPSFLASARCSSDSNKSGTTFPKRNFMRSRAQSQGATTLPKPRKFFSLPSSPLLASPPTMSSSRASPTKDANPELWESEGLKWGDRFQLLVHNFQFSAGKHSKKLADILPKNRWSKRSRVRSASESDVTRERANALMRHA
ncbi:hypothetical protein EDD21DRAFT_378620 [Dissophora ornata]|nr:hypothetical protein EDD21DRAFT_378620 [Dissophora ornata]